MESAFERRARHTHFCGNCGAWLLAFTQGAIGLGDLIRREEWLPYLDDPDATQEEKLALIDTLWGIVLSFVDLHWTIETEPACGSNLPPEMGNSSIDLTRALRAAMVHLDEPEKEEA